MPRRWSITRRLSVYFAFSSLVLMSAVGLYLSIALDRQLEHEHLSFLASDIANVRARLADSAAGTSPERAERLRQIVMNPIGSRLHIAVFDLQNHPLSDAPWLAVPFAELPAPVAAGETVDRSMLWSSPDGSTYRIVTALAAPGGGQAHSVMIALGLDVSIEQRLLAGYRRTMLLALLIAVLLSAVIGYAVARQGLLPVRRIASAANRISSTRLDERLSLAEAPTELLELIAAFNGMLDRLHESFERLSQFSSDLAHELRTPINNLMGEAQVALSRARVADEYRAVLESGVEEFERLSRMIENMLFLARADGDQPSIATVSIEARAELEKIAEFYQLIADESGVRIACEGAAGVNADPLLFRRAVSNLLSNALRYTAAGAQIVMKAMRNADGSATVSVSNPGAGIAAEHIERIFDRFYRVDPAREKTSEGAGLGLAIVRTIMQLHHGTVSARSDSGGMTTFALWFPAPPAV